MKGKGEVRQEGERKRREWGRRGVGEDEKGREER